MIGQSEGFFPVLDKTFKQPFALAIQYFDASSELQGISKLSSGGSNPVVHMLQSAHWNAYLTAYLVHGTHSRYEVFVPSLSSMPTFRKLPAKGAYYKSFTAAELLQFARALPTVHNRANHCADQTIVFTDFRERVWPEQWDHVKEAHTALKETVAAAEERDQEEIDEGLESGEHTGRWGVYKALGKSYRTNCTEHSLMANISASSRIAPKLVFR